MLVTKKEYENWKKEVFELFSCDNDIECLNENEDELTIKDTTNGEICSIKKIKNMQENMQVESCIFCYAKLRHMEIPVICEDNQLIRWVNKVTKIYKNDEDVKVTYQRFRDANGYIFYACDIKNHESKRFVGCFDRINNKLNFEYRLNVAIVYAKLRNMEIPDWKWLKMKEGYYLNYKYEIFN